MNSTGKSSCVKGVLVGARVLIWATCILAAASVPAVAEPPANLPAAPLTIIIDPGHGGGDVGARGPTGLTEKEVCLDLARRLMSLLEPQFRVLLTRSDDYAVDLRQRAATANQSKAGLLISIHAGSGFLHRTDGIGIFYFAPIKKSDIPQMTGDGSDSRQRWDEAHLRHRSASIALARSLEAHLDEVVPADKRTIEGVPLKLLEGVNLPAVIVEIGHITHPATEKDLSTPEGIERMGHALAKGIQAFAQRGAAVDRPSPASGSRP